MLDAVVLGAADTFAPLKRRRSIRAIALILSALAGIVLAYSIGIAPRWLRVSRLQVKVPNLPNELDGVRIAHLSDFHLGATGMTSHHLHRARAIAEDFLPDIIALTGDFYDGGRSSADSEGLYAGWPDDAHVLAVMGNHDRRGPSGTLNMIRYEVYSAGVTILDNKSTQINLRGRKVWIAGVDDPHTFNSDMKRAFEGIPAGESVLLFLSHAPSAILDIVPGQAAVMLAGHTHGGQIRLLPSGAVPLVEVIRRFRGAVERPDGPVYRRWHRINGTILLISDGLGVSSLPIRFKTRPHVVLIELVPAPLDDDRACDDVNRYVLETDREHWLLRLLT